MFARSKRSVLAVRHEASRVVLHTEAVHFQVRGYLRYSGLGLQFAFAVGLPVAGGYWLDGALDTSPWFLLGGAGLGGAAGFYQLLKAVFPGGVGTVSRKSKSSDASSFEKEKGPGNE